MFQRSDFFFARDSKPDVHLNLKYENNKLKNNYETRKPMINKPTNKSTSNMPEHLLNMH